MDIFWGIANAVATMILFVLVSRCLVRAHGEDWLLWLAAAIVYMQGAVLSWEDVPEAWTLVRFVVLTFVLTCFIVTFLFVVDVRKDDE